MIPLRQGTAVNILTRPFVSSSDGNTPMTALSIAYTDVLLTKRGSTTPAAKNETSSASHVSGGRFSLTLNATDVNTAGSLNLFIHVATALYMNIDFVVYPANVYDALIGTDFLQVDGVQVSGVGQTGNDNGADISTLIANQGNWLTADISTLATSTSIAALNALIDAIKAVTDNLPNNGALNNLAILEGRLTATRSGYLDYLNIGGLVASQASIQSITQASRVKVSLAQQLERPDNGAKTYRIWIYSYNELHQAEDLDSLPTITAENGSGTDRSSGLSTVIKPGGTTGQYYVDYTVSDSHLLEELIFKVDATEDGNITQYPASSIIVDTTAVDFTSTDRATLNDVKAVTELLPDAGALSSIAQNSTVAKETTLIARTLLAAVYATTTNQNIADGKLNNILSNTEILALQSTLESVATIIANLHNFNPATQTVITDNESREASKASTSELATSAEVSAIENKIDTMQIDITEVLDYESGDWKIIGDQLIFYKKNGSELQRFNLYKDGSLNGQEPDERRRIE